MNHTNTDYLFQTIPTGAGRVPNTTRADDGSGFDGHLSYASTSVFDAVHAARGAEAPAPSSTHDDPPRDAKDTDSRSTEYDENRSEADCSSVSSSASKNCAPPPGSSRAEDDAETARRDDEVDDDRDFVPESATAEAAAAKAQPAQKVNHSSAKASAKEATAAAGSQESARTRPDGNDASANGGIDKAQTNTAVDVTLTSTATAEVPDIGTDPAEIEAAVASSEESPTAESADGRRHDGSKTGHADGPVQVDIAAGGRSQPGAATQIVAATANSDELAPTATNADAANKKPANDETTKSDDDSRRGAKSPAGSSDRNDAVSPAKNVPTAAALAANLPNAIDIAPNAPEKDKSTVKPIKGSAETSVGPLGRAMRAATELARGNQASSGEESPLVDATRFVGRVAKAFQTAQERGGVLQLRLSPPELGALKLQLVVKDGVLSATLETENSHARRVLLDHLPALRDRLAEQNIRIERFDVDVQQENGRREANPRGSNQNPYQQEPEQSAPRRGQATQNKAHEMTAPAPSTVATPRIGATEINLIV